MDIFRMAIFGESGTGKSALAIRMLTRRYISSYVPNSPTVTVNRFIQIAPNAPAVPVAIRDVAFTESERSIMGHLQWSHANIVLITRDNSRSLEFARNVLKAQRKVGAKAAPTLLLVNKQDLDDSLKEVPLEDCLSLALECECPLAEISVKQGLIGSDYVVQTLLRDFQAQQRGPAKDLRLGEITQKVGRKVFGALVKSLCWPSEPANFV